MFLEPLPKGPRGLSYIFLITLHPTTFIAIYDPTFLHYRIQVLRGHQEVLDCFASSKVHLHPIVFTSLLDTLTQTECKNYGVQVYFRGGKTIKNLLMAPKDLDPMMKKSGVIYSYKCGRVECNEEYIGESSRTFGERFKEHQKAPSPIFDHFNNTGHSISVENFNIVGREDQNLKRAIKEALYIRVNNPSLDRNVGKYHLPHIWDEILYDIPELKLK